MLLPLWKGKLALDNVARVQLIGTQYQHFKFLVCKDKLIVPIFTIRRLMSSHRPCTSMGRNHLKFCDHFSLKPWNFMQLNAFWLVSRVVDVLIQLVVFNHWFFAINCFFISNEASWKTSGKSLTLVIQHKLYRCTKQLGSDRLSAAWERFFSTLQTTSRNTHSIHSLRALICCSTYVAAFTHRLVVCNRNKTDETPCSSSRPRIRPW